MQLKEKNSKRFITVDKETRRERLLVCESCEHNKFNLCKKCGCIIPAKTKLKHSSCPIGKW